jgi:hypothetical protein
LSEIKPRFENLRIRNQKWMTINLDMEQFRNGDLIPYVESNEEWERVGKKIENGSSHHTWH